MERIIFVSRIIRDDLAGTFKFEVLYRELVVFTNGVSYNSLKDCSDALSEYLSELYNYNHQPLQVDLFTLINNKNHKL